MIESINALTLASHDMQRAVRFYCKLGFTVHFGDEESSFTTLHAGTCRLNLVAQPADRRWNWWGRVIFYVTDVDMFYRDVLANGITADSEPRDAEWGERFFHLTDPDGHQLSFAHPILPRELTDKATSF